jgi:hypothetical protein
VEPKRGVFSICFTLFELILSQFYNGLIKVNYDFQILRWSPRTDLNREPADYKGVSYFRLDHLNFYEIFSSNLNTPLSVLDSLNHCKYRIVILDS